MNTTTLPILGKRIEDTFAVVYPVAGRVLEYLNELVQHPNRHRPQGALVVSEAFNGKTFIMRMLQKDVAALPAPPNVVNYVPSIMFDAPVGASRRDLYQEFAAATRIPHASGLSADKLRAQCIQALRERGVRVVLIDELQHLIAGPEMRKRIILDDFKKISNATGIPFICSGTLAAYQVIETDEQYLSRLRPLALPKWQMNREFASLLKCLEKELGVTPGTFCNPETSRVILQLSKGLIGRVVDIFNGSLKEALRDGAPSITRAHIERSGFSDIPWIHHPEDSLV